MGFSGGFKQGKPTKALLELNRYLSVKRTWVKWYPQPGQARWKEAKIVLYWETKFVAKKIHQCNSLCGKR